MKWPLLSLLLCLAATLQAQPAARHEILITELMPDPLPSAGLPVCEYLELKNVSGRPIDLNRWKITDGNSTAIITGPQLLPADSQLTICSRSFVTELSAFGRTVGVSSFPSLDNNGDRIVLLSPEGAVIHAVAYEKAWFGNVLKSEGGWSLEMMDVRLPCQGAANWVASAGSYGGTPGQPNSVAGSGIDTSGPLLLRSFATDARTVFLYFNEPLDSPEAANPLRYTFDRDIGHPILATPLAPLFDRVELRLLTPLQQAIVYTLAAQQVRDCHRNIRQEPQPVKVGLTGDPAVAQIRVNELLFNPRTDGVDYIELLNRGPGIIDADKLYIGNRATVGSSDLVRCSKGPFAVFPGEHLVLSSDTAAVSRYFIVKNPALLLELDALPSLPDDAGAVFLWDDKGKELDVLRYTASQHFPLLREREGVALERIDPAAPTDDPANWHSASSDAGYGTPTRRNSQSRIVDSVQGEIKISPETFSPDMDGSDDFLTIDYRFPTAGYSCSIIISDAAGRPVRYLVRNSLCGTDGYFRWNGLDENNHRLPAGQYIVVTDYFNLKGRRKVHRKAIVLAYARG